MHENNLQIVGYDAACKLAMDWPDIYYSPFYGKASALMDGGEWMVAIWQNGRIIFPFIKRQVPNELTDGETWFDVISPYGYSGTALAQDCVADDFVTFRRELTVALKQQRCVTEFHRQGSFVAGAELMQGVLGGEELRHIANTLQIPLDGGHEMVFARYEGRARTKVRKAKKLGYSWSCRPAVMDDALPDSIFRALYQSTMERLGAAPYYLFSDEYFQSLISGLSDRVFVYSVNDASGVAKVAGIFFVWRDILHLHLVGSDPESLRDGAGNLGYDGLVEWACNHGECKRIHIGGGVSGEDSLYEFKKSFGGVPTPFFIYSNIIDPSVYQALCARRAALNGAGITELMSKKYFPHYRIR